MSRTYRVINNELYHHGILGQKWGIRRYQNEDGSLTPRGEKRYSEGKQIITKNGEKMNIVVSKTKKYGKAGDSDYSEETVHTAYVNGKKVLTAYLDSKDSDMNINWISTKTKEQGKGYAQAAMQHLVDYSIKTGHKTMSLEVPDNDANAEHIYKKYGFEKDGNRYEDVLSVMKKKL